MDKQSHMRDNPLPTQKVKDFTKLQKKFQEELKLSSNLQLEASSSQPETLPINHGSESKNLLTQIQTKFKIAELAQQFEIEQCSYNALQDQLTLHNDLFNYITNNSHIINYSRLEDFHEIHDKYRQLMEYKILQSSIRQRVYNLEMENREYNADIYKTGITSNKDPKIPRSRIDSTPRISSNDSEVQAESQRHDETMQKLRDSFQQNLAEEQDHQDNINALKDDYKNMLKDSQDKKQQLDQKQVTEEIFKEYPDYINNIIKGIQDEFTKEKNDLVILKQNAQSKLLSSLSDVRPGQPDLILQEIQSCAQELEQKLLKVEQLAKIQTEIQKLLGPEEILVEQAQVADSSSQYTPAPDHKSLVCKQASKMLEKTFKEIEKNHGKTKEAFLEQMRLKKEAYLAQKKAQHENPEPTTKRQLNTDPFYGYFGDLPMNNVSEQNLEQPQNPTQAMTLEETITRSNNTSNIQKRELPKSSTREEQHEKRLRGEQ